MMRSKVLKMKASRVPSCVAMRPSLASQYTRHNSLRTSARELSLRMGVRFVLTSLSCGTNASFSCPMHLS